MSPERKRPGAFVRAEPPVDAGADGDDQDTKPTTRLQESTTRTLIRTISALLSAAEARAAALPESYRTDVVESLNRAQESLAACLGGGAVKRSGTAR
jgi:hypothetical protein